MASATISGRVVGLEDLVRRMDGIKNGIRNKLLRKATTKASRLIQGLAKARANRAAYKYFSVRRGKVVNSGYTQGQLASLSLGKASVGKKLRALESTFGPANRRRTGLLKKSLGFKITTTHRGTVIGVIGPRRGFKAQVGVTTRDGPKTKKGTPIFEDPANIAHLVEFGHGGPHPAQPRPFMRPAWDQGSRVAQAIYREVLGAGLAELAKGGTVDDGGSAG